MIEDDDDLRFVIRLALTRNTGFELTDFSNAFDAIETLQTLRRPFDVAIVDMHIPGMSGPDFVKAMRGIPVHHETPVIYMTAALFRIDEQNLSDLYIHGVIPKPFEALRLPEMVQGLLEQADGRGLSANGERYSDARPDLRPSRCTESSGFEASDPNGYVSRVSSEKRRAGSDNRQANWGRPHFVAPPPRGNSSS
ncbi:response regulator [Sphingomonas crocodyli]|uniref:response regulator n=1 Tax=Sphingomonas crocodyli TaxID=1979270 RepID=UPI0013E2A367|nr:response regulator [Sphingomonas crocodyli]